MKLSELPEEDRKLAEKCFQHMDLPSLPTDSPLHNLPELLRQHRFLVKVTDDEGKTLLHWASLKGDDAACTELLKGGADVNARDNEGTTPLYWHLQVSTAKALIRPDTQINAQDHDGNTLLHMAFESGAVGLLLRHGANPNIQNHEGRLPAQGHYTNIEIKTAIRDINNIISNQLKDPSYLTRKRLLNKDKVTDLTQNICASGLFYEKLFRPLLNSGNPEDRQLLDDVFHAFPSQWQIRFTHLYTVFAREQTQKAFDPMALTSGREK